MLQKKNIIAIIYFLFLTVTSYTVNAQITGNTIVAPNSIETYTYSNGNSKVFWSVAGGEIISNNLGSTIEIRWGNVGNGEVSVSFGFGLSDTISITITSDIPPSTPPTPTVVAESPDCSSVTLSKSGDIPTGVMWYWQGANGNGTSTSLPATNNYVVNHSSNYYIRAKDLNTGLWSTQAAWIKIILGAKDTWYLDSDNDGYGDPNISIEKCIQPPGYVNNDNDLCPEVYGESNGCPSFSVDELSNDNYIYTITPKKGVNNLSQINQINDATHEVEYFDGLGRSKQKIAIMQSSIYKDIVTHVAYDNLGRKAKQFLPYVASTENGLIKNNAHIATNDYYIANYATDISTTNPNPYSEKKYDNSPLNRVLEQAAPGKDWKVGNNHTIKFEYGTNTHNEVLNFGVGVENGNTATPTLQIAESYYAAGSLYKTITKDENWQTWNGKNKTTEEYKNKQGQVLLKRTYNRRAPHDTHYVYDDFGNLSYVLPPLVNEQTAFYETGLTTYPASTFVTGGNATGSVTLGIEQTAPGTFRYVTDIDLHNLANSEFKTGEIMDLPNAPASMSSTWLGSASAWSNTNGFYAYKSVTFYANMGKLMCYAYTYNQNNIPLTLSDFERTTHSVLPQNLQGFTEAATQEKVNELLEDLCYQYKYDHRNRLIEKKIPGKGWESIVYDNLDRPVLTQDANLKAQNKWLFTKYDILGRVAYTGIYANGASRSTHQNAINTYTANQPTRYYEDRSPANTNNGVQLNYSNKAYPNSSHLSILTLNYYDSYADLPAGFSPPTSVYNQPVTTNTKTLLTVSKVRVLDTNDWITTLTYYDEKARPIYVYAKNDYLHTIDIIESKLDFTGKVLETTTTHKKTGKPALITVDKLDYDHADRLLTHKQTINNQDEELLAKNSYDALGQLIQKEVGDTEASPLQDIDYRYNIRGWLKKINDPKTGLGSKLFSMQLSYNDDGRRLYNGNISKTEWKTASDNIKRRYNYYYDDLNRITYASYYSWSESARFNLGSISYDKNGNLQRLYRRGAIVDNPEVRNPSHYGTMDYLSYNYKGNQLIKVTDNGNDNYGFKDGTNTGDDYVYDANGNLTSDTNKGIASITYNHLNLPERVDFGNNKYIDYTYDASGVKLRKRVRNGSTFTNTDYASNYIYENNALQFFNTAEGYATPNSSGNFDYIYQYKDHLGNVRLSYTENTANSQETIFTDGFESMSNWDRSENSFGWALSAIDSSKKKTGTYSGRIDDNYPSNWEKYVFSDTWTPIENTEDTYYTVSGWVFVEAIANNDAQIWLMTRRAGENGYPTGAFNTLSTKRGSWEYLEKTVLVPADVRELNVRIDNNRDGTVWFDDVKIVKGNAARTVVVAESNYYPFGLKHKGYNNTITSNGNSTAQKFGYQSKELQEELGLDWMDFGARNYDAAIGRWMNIDPLAEKYDPLSPYNAMLNNPIISIDPDGRAAMWIPEVNSETGETSYVAEEGDSAESLSNQYGVSQSKAEAITGTKGSDKIKEGTTISGKTVAKNNNGNNVLRLDVGNENTTDADMVHQTLFAVRNETVKDKLSDTPDGKGNLYDYFKTRADGKPSYGRVFGIDGKSRVNLTILGDIKLNLSVSFALYDGTFSTSLAADRQVSLGGGKYQRNLDFNYPSNGKKGFAGLTGRIFTLTSRSGNRNTNTLRNYLSGSDKKDKSFYD